MFVHMLYLHGWSSSCWQDETQDIETFLRTEMQTLTNFVREYETAHQGQGAPHTLHAAMLQVADLLGIQPSMCSVYDAALQVHYKVA